MYFTPSEDNDNDEEFKELIGSHISIKLIKYVHSCPLCLNLLIFTWDKSNFSSLYACPGWLYLIKLFMDDSDICWFSGSYWHLLVQWLLLTSVSSVALTDTCWFSGSYWHLLVQWLLLTSVVCNVNLSNRVCTSFIPEWGGTLFITYKTKWVSNKMIEVGNKTHAIDLNTL